MAAADGGIFAFGDARFFGSLSNTTLNKAVASIAPTPNGGGYWLAAADGGVFAFGNASFRGSASGVVPSGGHVVALAVGPGLANATGAAGDFFRAVPPPVQAQPQAVQTDAPGAVGYDISWPQCAGPLPAPSALAIVGVNNGTAFTVNPCFAGEADWAGLNLSVYINLNAPDPTKPYEFASGPAGPCPPGAAACDSYNYGYNAVLYDLSIMFLSRLGATHVWLDVETENIWSAYPLLNDQVIAGAITALHNAGIAAGIYSTGLQYSEIAGSFNPSTPEWLATGAPLTDPSSGCQTHSFTGGPVTLVQGSFAGFDGDVAC
jgi:hypothetical protein